ncbi:MAG: DUF4235 domain-containing protein [Gemmatimonadetes bacterium]|nr:DUF4235 domain-containing protein [Gemmatimonadota bacterium]
MAKMNPVTHGVAWVLVSTGTTLLARKALDSALSSGWRAVTRKDPPHRTGKHASWPEVLAWAATTAAAAAVVELLVHEGVARGWKSATGHNPPGKW